MAVERKYQYKVFRDGVFLGLLPYIRDPFSYNQYINTPGSETVVHVSYSAVKNRESVDELITESGETITTEDGEALTTEGAELIIGNDTERSLIRTNNDIEVWEISSDNPNGKLVFSGYISKWRAVFGPDLQAEVTILSYGAELANYIIEGGTTLDLSQTTIDNELQAYEPFKGGAWLRHGQTFTIGSGVTNLHSVALKLHVAAGVGGSVGAVLKIWNSVNDFFTGTPIGTATRVISATSAEEYIFTFTSPITVTPGAQYFMSIQSEDYRSIYISYTITQAYAGGNAWQSYFSGSSGGSWVEYADDIYFKTYYTAGATSVPYSSVSPESIIQSIIDSYVNRGGTVDYDGSSIDATGITTSYTFKINTILEGIRKVLELSPAGFYWYVDPATNILYFKETGTTADHTMILGRHIKHLEIEASIEDLKNTVYFSGGDTGGGENLFMKTTDTESLEANRVGLERVSDNRVTLSNTATLISQSVLDTYSDEVFMTELEITAATYDISDFNLGEVVGFGGFGNFVDRMLLQIVGITRSPESVNLKLGILPKRTTKTIEQILRSVQDIQTIDNPSVPS